jgi:hypothetical protein
MLHVRAAAEEGLAADCWTAFTKLSRADLFYWTAIIKLLRLTCSSGRRGGWIGMEILVGVYDLSPSTSASAWHVMVTTLSLFIAKECCVA